MATRRKRAPAPGRTKLKASGCVTAQDGHPVQGATIHLFQKSPQAEHLLGKGKTNSAGKFQIAYFCHTDCPSVLVRAYDPAGKHLIAESRAIVDAGPDATIKLSVTTSDRLPKQSLSNIAETVRQKWLLQIAQGQISETCREIEKMLQDDGDQSTASVLNDLGEYCWGQKEASTAIEFLSHALYLAERSGDIHLRAMILGNLGNIYCATESYESALSYFEEAADLYKRYGESDWHLMMLISVGNALDGLHRVDEASAQYRTVAALAESLGALPEKAVAIGNLGNLFGKAGSFLKARKAHTAALRIAWDAAAEDQIRKQAWDLSCDLRSLGDTGVGDAESLASKAMLAWKKGLHSLAITGLDSAILLINEQQAPLPLAELLDCLAQLHRASSDLRAALESSQKAVALAQTDERKLADYLLNLSRICIDSGDLAEALSSATESFTHARNSNNSGTAIKALGNLGIVSQKRGDLSAAESYLQRQYDLAREAKDQTQLAIAANALGALFAELGTNQERSEQFFEEAHRLAAEHGLAELEVRCLNNLAIMEERRPNANRDRAAAMYRKAIAESIAIDLAEPHFDAALNLARLLSAQGNTKEASTILKTAEDLADRLGDRERRAEVSRVSAELALKQGQLQVARDAFQAAGYALKETNPERSADCFVDAASIAFQQLLSREHSSKRKLTEEERNLLLDEILRDLVLPLSTYERMAHKLDDYSLWVLVQRQEKAFRLFLDVVLRLFGPNEALATVERGRGRALRLAMHRRLAGQRTSAFHISELHRRIAFQILTHTQRIKGSPLSPEQFQALSRGLQRKDPDTPDLNEQQLAEIAGSLHAPVVEFAFGIQEDLHAWVTTKEATHYCKLDVESIGGIAGLRKSISQLRASIGLTRDLGLEFATPTTDCTPLLEKLYRILISPIETWLPKDIGAPVCIVPDGPLFEVPFAALQGADGRAVLDRWSVCEVPALSFFAVTPEEPGKGFLVVGDPTPPPAAEREWGKIKRLPFARDEAQEVARLYGATALVDKDATKEKVESALEAAEVIHLAAHAFLSRTRPRQSAIILAATAQDDGLVRVRDIDEKTLQARLVVLSCCSTGGGVITGDGVLSLCRSLLAAGAHSVLASLWAVADESTCFTMIDFHSRIVENPFQSTLADLFRQSQLATRQKYPHHAQWAPFVLWGWPHWVQSVQWHVPHAPVLGKTS